LEETVSFFCFRSFLDHFFEQFLPEFWSNLVVCFSANLFGLRTTSIEVNHCEHWNRFDTGYAQKNQTVFFAI